MLLVLHNRPMNFKTETITYCSLLRDFIVFINYYSQKKLQLVLWQCKQVIYMYIPNHIDCCIYSYLQASWYVVPDLQRDSVKDKKVSQKWDTCNLIPNWPSSLVKYWQDRNTFLNI